MNLDKDTEIEEMQLQGQERQILYVTEKISNNLINDPQLGYPNDTILSDLVKALGRVLYEVCHDLDLTWTGDKDIGDIVKYRSNVLIRIQDILNKHKEEKKM